mmetsp:Transcript_452/g.658  ORF Transcript_452/g.658 Transcript_452/m.658 type:complete len:203 (-) Transcript_452:186-794(-)
MDFQDTLSPASFPTEQISLSPSGFIYGISDPNYELTAMDYVWFSFSWILRIVGTFTIMICLIKFAARGNSEESVSNEVSTGLENESDSEDAKEIRIKVINAIFIEKTVDEESFEYDSESNAYQFKGKTDDTMNSNTCSICIDKFQEGDGVIISACSHVFHRDCVLEWLQKKDECPMCRQGMWDQDDYKKLEQQVIEEMNSTN